MNKFATKFGHFLAYVLFSCIAALIIAVTVKLIIWIF